MNGAQLKVINLDIDYYHVKRIIYMNKQNTVTYLYNVLKVDNKMYFYFEGQLFYFNTKEIW